MQSPRHEHDASARGLHLYLIHSTRSKQCLSVISRSQLANIQHNTNAPFELELFYFPKFQLKSSLLTAEWSSATEIRNGQWTFTVFSFSLMVYIFFVRGSYRCLSFAVMKSDLTLHCRDEEKLMHIFSNIQNRRQHNEMSKRIFGVLFFSPESGQKWEVNEL